MRGFFVSMALLVLMAAALIGGIAVSQPGLLLPWACLSVPVAFWAGRCSARVYRGVRVVFARDNY